MAKLNITKDDGELLAQIDLDEYDLRRNIARGVVMDEILDAVRVSGEGRTNQADPEKLIGQIRDDRFNIVGTNAISERCVIAHRATREEAEAFTRNSFAAHYTDVEIIPPAVPAAS